MSETVSRRRTGILICCTTCHQVSPLIRPTAEVIVISAQVRWIQRGRWGPSGHECRGKCYIPSALHRYAVCVLTSPLPLWLPPLCLRRPGLFSYCLRPGAPADDYMNYLQCVNPLQLLFVFTPPPTFSQSGESRRSFFLSLLSLSHNFVTSPSCHSLPVSAPGVRLCLALCLFSPSL